MPLHLLLIVIFSITQVNANERQEKHQQLNMKLSAFQKAFESLDTKQLQNIYHEDAVFISENRNDPIVVGKQNILSRYQHFFDKITHKNARLEVDFRVVERNIYPQNVIDIGYYIVRFHPDKASGDPISEFAGKFVNNYIEHKKDNWLLTVDSNTRSQAELYYNAKPIANLYYGRQFIQPTE
ncbi:DUF4440 domain-containing protein [Shewanella intestini]|uniref:DUF4440 domain-containing protein n=2 Tax=Shewanellaceae TaxID=267890 RepID=A0ABS5HZR7_9GAMM|nr:DUF4440 domain-containing protein [Shewanella intestini]MRG36063.1 DUF4440 domain-containing protein [Shewanella sp. XMDDZSB0408]